LTFYYHTLAKVIIARRAYLIEQGHSRNSSLTEGTLIRKFVSWKEKSA